MTTFNPEDMPREGQDIGARGRLRDARRAVGLSSRDLAIRIGRSASSVRAHESGQNAIGPDAAEIYADALGVSPVWLLFGGDGGPEPGRAIRQQDFLRIPIAGHVSKGGWIDRREVSGTEEIAVSLSGYSQETLTALTVGGGVEGYVPGDIIIVEKAPEGLLDGDHLVALTSRDLLVHFSLHRVALSSNGIQLHGLSGSARRLGRRNEQLGFAGRPQETVEIVGVVIAWLHAGRRGKGPLVSYDGMNDLAWLG